MKTLPWQPDQKFQDASGLTGTNPTRLRTQVETLLSLATTKNEAGMRLALGIKIASFVKVGGDGKPCFTDFKSKAFPHLCLAIAEYSQAARDTLQLLLESEFNWANRFLPFSLQSGQTIELMPPKMPMTRWRLLHQLAGSFGQSGTEFALRMFIKPFFVGEQALCEINPYCLTQFLDESFARRDHVPAQINVAFAKPEFAPFAHLAGAGAASATSSAILGPSNPSSGGPIMDF